MPSVFATVVFILVALVALATVVHANLLRTKIAEEVAALVMGIERRTASSSADADHSATPSNGSGEHEELDALLDEAVQGESHQLAVLAVNELTGRAGLARSRARLLSQGLPRISLLSGAGGAIVIVAVGSFSQSALVSALASIVLGIGASFSCHSVNAASRKHAKKYAELVDVLARQTDRHFAPDRPSSEGVPPRPLT